MKFRKHVLFTLLFASVLLFVACDKEERKEYYGNGALKSITTYRDSVKNGQYISYYENGKVWAKGQYKNDEKDGAWNTYRENGKIAEEVNYKSGQVDGEWKT